MLLTLICFWSSWILSESPPATSAVCGEKTRWRLGLCVTEQCVSLDRTRLVVFSIKWAGPACVICHLMITWVARSYQYDLPIWRPAQTNQTSSSQADKQRFTLQEKQYFSIPTECEQSWKGPIKSFTQDFKPNQINTEWVLAPPHILLSMRLQLWQTHDCINTTTAVYIEQTLSVKSISNKVIGV